MRSSCPIGGSSMLAALTNGLFATDAASFSLELQYADEYSGDDDDDILSNLLNSVVSPTCGQDRPHFDGLTWTITDWANPIVADSESTAEEDEGSPTQDTRQNLQTYKVVPKLAKKTAGNVMATKFVPPKKSSGSPLDLFPDSMGPGATKPSDCYVTRSNATELLVYTDGACFDNGGANARAGCSFVFQPVRSREDTGRIAFRLEVHGADGKVYKHMSNRAELRAIVAALKFRPWHSEWFKSIVIATDSNYVVNGATDWVRAWIRKRWRLSTGAPVKNRDWWEALLLSIEGLHEHGMAVRFWRIPRKWNHAADQAAKGAAAVLDATSRYTNIVVFPPC